MIPTTEAQPSNPVWLPDGDRAVFAAPPGGYTRLHWVKVDGSAPSSPVGGEVPARASEYPGSWTPDGKSLLFTRETRETPAARLAIWQLRVDGGQPQRSALVEPPGGRNAATALVTQPAVSPDGRWLAYASTQSGRSEVYVQRLPDLAGRQQLSRDGGLAPLWRRDNRELFYVTEGPKRKMMAIDVRPGADFAVGLPRVLFELSDDLYTGAGQTAPFDVSLDGQRFLFVRLVTEPVPPPPSQMHVVLNWFEELKAKVPSK
jgi:serine/threonine-protein kinase